MGNDITRGPKPKPTALKLIEGNPGKRAVNDAEPNAGPIGEPPEDLDGLALEKWREMSRLWRLVLTAADRDQLAQYCRLEVERGRDDRRRRTCPIGMEDHPEQVPRGHPLYRLLHREPNNWQTAFDFRNLMQLRALLNGNAYALIVRSGRCTGKDKIVRIVSLDPDNRHNMRAIAVPAGDTHTEARAHIIKIKPSLRGRPNLDAPEVNVKIRPDVTAIGSLFGADKAAGQAGFG